MKEEIKKRKQENKQLLPTPNEVKVIDYFGFKPFSIIKPTKESKSNWNEAYFDDGEIDERKGYGVRNDEGVAKMSEFHAGLAENLIRYWSLPGARVIDPFAGRVTRAVVTEQLGREYYGYEITPNTHKRALKHFEKLGINPTLYLGDGTRLNETENQFADMVMTCPPYFDIEKYESVEGQLSDIGNYSEFMEMMSKTAENCFRVLKEGGFCVWVVADFRKDCKLIPFHSDLIQSFMKAGFDNHDLIVMENISPFAAMQLAKAAAKRYTSKVHEYILVFRKPGEYIVPNYCLVEEPQSESDIKLNQFFSS
jgi:DNA modification methylase